MIISILMRIANRLFAEQRVSITTYVCLYIIFILLLVAHSISVKEEKVFNGEWWKGKGSGMS